MNGGKCAAIRNSTRTEFQNSSMKYEKFPYECVQSFGIIALLVCERHVQNDKQINSF